MRRGCTTQKWTNVKPQSEPRPGYPPGPERLHATRLATAPTGCPLGPALLRSTSYARIISIGGHLGEAPHFYVAHPLPVPRRRRLAPRGREGLSQGLSPPVWPSSCSSYYQ